MDTYNKIFHILYSYNNIYFCKIYIIQTYMIQVQKKRKKCLRLRKSLRKIFKKRLRKIKIRF